MFLMVQSLLAERFQLAARFENRELPVFEVKLVRPGKLGPNMPPHANGPPCGRPGIPARPGLPGFVCHSFFELDLPGTKIFGARCHHGHSDADIFEAVLRDWAAR